MKAGKKAAKKLERRVISWENTMRGWKGHPGAFTKPGSNKK